MMPKTKYKEPFIKAIQEEINILKTQEKYNNANWKL